MYKIYKVECYDWRKFKPVYFDNLVDLVEYLTMSYFKVCVDGSEDLLNAIRTTALLYYPLFHKGIDYTIWSSGMNLQDSSGMTCVVSEVEVDQNGNLLSTSS